MDAYFCEQCGWVYDPEEGSEELKIKASVEFSKLPADFVCPECGCPKSDFVRLDSEYEYDFDDEEEDEDDYEDDDEEEEEDDEEF